MAATVTTISAVTQAVLAGRLVAGDITALGLHSGNGVGLVVGGLLLLVALLLVWRPGGGPGWAPVAGAVVLAATVLQVTLGFRRTLAVHVPLGVFVIIAEVLLLLWSWRRPLPGGHA